MFYCIDGLAEIQKNAKDYIIIIQPISYLSDSSIESMNGRMLFTETELFFINNIMFIEKRCKSFVEIFFKNLGYYRK